MNSSKGAAWPPLPFSLFTKPEFFDQCAVPFDILVLQICQKASALTDHFQKAAVGMEVFLVDLHVSCKLIDPLGKERDLHFR